MPLFISPFHLSLFVVENWFCIEIHTADDWSVWHIQLFNLLRIINNQHTIAVFLHQTHFTYYNNNWTHVALTYSIWKMWKIFKIDMSILATVSMNSKNFSHYFLFNRAFIIIIGFLREKWKMYFNVASAFMWITQVSTDVSI